MSKKDNAPKDPARPLARAKSKAGAVQRELAVAGAELNLTNTALERHLPSDTKQGDVRKALNQADVIEQKVNDAAQELAQVTELLQEEIEQVHKLEAELARKS